MRGREFPARAFEALGYNCAVHGQKTYNGVAILSKRPLEDVTPRLPGNDGDDHARYLEALVTGDKGVVRVASIYAPNGNPLRHREIRLQAGLAGAAARPCRASCWPTKSRWR